MSVIMGFYTQRWQAYVEKYGRPEEGVDPELKEILAKRKIFLKRYTLFSLSLTVFYILIYNKH